MKRRMSPCLALLALAPLLAAPPARGENDPAPSDGTPAAAAETPSPSAEIPSPPAETPAPAPKPCTAPEASQFDFWVGEWDLTWGDDGQGMNVITRELGGCVVSEHFQGGGLEGRSWTVWVPALGAWKQTWVDNSGGYLDFTGSRQEDRMVLMREAPENPKATHQRMVFREIRGDSFTWDWETSADGGDTWDLRWQIHYTRRT